MEYDGLTRNQAHAYRERRRLNEIARVLAEKRPATKSPAKRSAPAPQFPPTLVTGSEWQRNKAEYEWWRDVKAQRDPSELSAILAKPIAKRKSRRSFTQREYNELGGWLFGYGYTARRDGWTQVTLRLWFDFDSLLYVAVVPLADAPAVRTHAMTLQNLARSISFLRPPKMSRTQAAAVAAQQAEDRKAARAERRRELDRQHAANVSTMTRTGNAAALPTMNDRLQRRRKMFLRVLVQAMYKDFQKLSRSK